MAPTKLKFAADKTERRKVADLKPYPRNPKTHPASQIASLVAMIREFGFTQPLIVDEDDMILAGHGRRLAAIEMGLAEVPVVVLPGLSDNQKRAIVIADNKSNELGGWDQGLLILELGELKRLDYNLDLTGFNAGDLVTFVAQQATDAAERESSAGKLSERFGIPPFSTLNAREGWWQDRKRAWLSIGIQSELGRGENLLKFSATINEPDPVKRAAKKAERQAAKDAAGQAASQ